jgi:methyl-accepting chemotaxis protein
MADRLNEMIQHLKAVEISFNRMALSYLNVIQQFSRQSLKLNQSATQLEIMSATIGEEVSLIHQAASTVENGSLHQNSSVIETRDRLNQMSETISVVSNGASEQTDAVKKTGEIMQDLSRIIETVVQKSKSQAEAARKSTETVHQSAGTVNSAVMNLKNIRGVIDQSSEKNAGDGRTNPADRCHSGYYK